MADKIRVRVEHDVVQKIAEGDYDPVKWAKLNDRAIMHLVSSNKITGGEIGLDVEVDDQAVYLVYYLGVAQ